ncbi:cytochrome C [Helicobacter cholecystus]|uniref:Cytochrome C n=1 Tax=Helicobacter cholecystus TaxID=45498 RepID=A0A3D8IX13_9HELI|nr:c-type cytochrome [Helicobacter cholecystus]RDU69111.1 cytochrome C [Helicobacter cholecystus]VEJ24642.1 ubiquinol-cytochrome C reductase cytochrome subunit C [Helicobacter cholecystus]
MREFKILIILIAIIGVIYWGVEPLAHSVFHPAKAPADYTFADIKDIQVTLQGNAKSGKTLVEENCAGCHNMKTPENELKARNADGVMGPDLDTMGYLYAPQFLTAFLKDPLKATLLAQKLKGKEDVYQMSSIAGAFDDQQIADMVAYLQSIAPKQMSDREVFIDACSRCHDIKYDGINGLKGIKVAAPSKSLLEYLGAPAPDLSTMYRSRGEHYLTLFINDPQKMLPGASMPRVGLNQKAESQVLAYMENIADAKKEERESLGIKLIIFCAIMAILAYLWKCKIWREVH